MAAWSTYFPVRAPRRPGLNPERRQALNEVQSGIAATALPCTLARRATSPDECPTSLDQSDRRSRIIKYLTIPSSKPLISAATWKPSFS